MGNDGNVLYLDCGGGSTDAYICQNSSNCTPSVHFNVCKFGFNLKIKLKRIASRACARSGDMIVNKAGRAPSRGNFCLAPKSQSWGRTDILLPSKSPGDSLGVALGSTPQSMMGAPGRWRAAAPEARGQSPKGLRVSQRSPAPQGGNILRACHSHRVQWGQASLSALLKNFGPQNLMQEGHIKSFFQDRRNRRYAGPETRISFGEHQTI